MRSAVLGLSLHGADLLRATLGWLQLHSLGWQAAADRSAAHIPVPGCMNGSASGSLMHLKLKKGVHQMLWQVWHLAA